jgi:hypothetical protein
MLELSCKRPTPRRLVPDADRIRMSRCGLDPGTLMSRIPKECLCLHSFQVHPRRVTTMGETKQVGRVPFIEGLLDAPQRILRINRLRHHPSRRLPGTWTRSGLKCSVGADACARRKDSWSRVVVQLVWRFGRRGDRHSGCETGKGNLQINGDPCRYAILAKRIFWVSNIAPYSSFGHRCRRRICLRPLFRLVSSFTRSLPLFVCSEVVCRNPIAKRQGNQKES